MKHLLCASSVSLALILSAASEPVTLVKAADLVTRFMTDTKIAEKAMTEFFVVSALVRASPSREADPAAVEWRVMLAETKLDRAGAGTSVAFKEEGREYRRVLEIRGDGTVVIGKIAGGQPRARVIPPPKK